MIDVFEVINQWPSRLNLFRDHCYLRNVAFIFSLSMVIPWLLLGFDSGVGMLEVWTSNWQVNYEAYGKSLHFSAFTIYGLLFYGISKHLQGLGITKSKNVFYSASLSVFNIGIFEMWYMGSFAVFQMQRSPFEWFISDFWEIPVVMNFMFMVLGSIALISVYLDSFMLNSGKVIGRIYRFQQSYIKTVLILGFVVVGVLFWIYYPFPTETAFIYDWQSSPLFPQTHYAYVNSKLYIPNDLLHLVNVIVKGLFAGFQFYLLTRFKMGKVLWQESLGN